MSARTYAAAYGHLHKELCIVDLSDFTQVQLRIDYGAHCRDQHHDDNGCNTIHLTDQDLGRNAINRLSSEILKAFVRPGSTIYIWNRLDEGFLREELGTARYNYLLYQGRRTSGQACAVRRAKELALAILHDRVHTVMDDSYSPVSPIYYSEDESLPDDQLLD